MRSTSRLFATVKSAAKYLEPNTPTGLTGLGTHPAPRTALVYNYRTTLAKLTQLPTSSVYRQSVEALTIQRLKIVEDEVPEGYNEYLERVKKQIDASPAAYGFIKRPDGSWSYASYAGIDKPAPWDGDVTKKDAQNDGVNTLDEVQIKLAAAEKETEKINRAAKEGVMPTVDDLESEPPLTADQISSIENKIGAGLIEEVIAVAEGELGLVDQMLQDKPWEPLEEQAPSGQWSYFERGDRV